jgi:AcrR family transcriptional regulator
MPARASPTKTPANSVNSRADLSRERIIAAALTLIDEQGLAALNMRVLGAALGASTMSVYRHFRDKGDLLNAAVDTVVAGFAPGSKKGDWRDHAKAMSLTVRAAMLAHPELAELIGKEFRRSPTSLKVNVEIIERLAASGVPEPLLVETYWALSCYTTGHALLEAQALRRRNTSENRRGNAVGANRRNGASARVRKLEALLGGVDGIDANAIPKAAQVLAQPLDDKQFLFGLESLLDGIDKRLGAYRKKSRAYKDA